MDPQLTTDLGAQTDLVLARNAAEGDEGDAALLGRIAFSKASEALRQLAVLAPTVSALANMLVTPNGMLHIEGDRAILELPEPGTPNDPSAGGGGGAPQTNYILYQDSATTYALLAWTGNYLGAVTYPGSTGNTLAASQDVYLEITIVVGTGITSIDLFSNAAGTGVTNSGTVRYLYLGTVTWTAGAISALVATVFQNGELLPCGSYIYCLASP